MCRSRVLGSKPRAFMLIELLIAVSTIMALPIGVLQRSPIQPTVGAPNTGASLDQACSLYTRSGLKDAEFGGHEVRSVTPY
jgi:hypothetical protein